VQSACEEDDDSPLCPPLHLEACELITSVSTKVENISEQIDMPVDLVDSLSQIKGRLRGMETKARTVAVVGRTGVGKSTLNCALLKSSVLPSSSLVIHDTFTPRVLSVNTDRGIYLLCHLGVR
jgi:ribosome biogenesis GTPase A